MTKVLVIDDDVDMTDVLKTVLQQAGFEVKAVYSSTLGLQEAPRWNPDVIILDLLMPGMDGLQVCQKVREFSTVPILMLSVINRPDTIAKSLDAGADDYLVKPVPASVLTAHINKLARRSRLETIPSSLDTRA